MSTRHVITMGLLLVVFAAGMLLFSSPVFAEATPPAGAPAAGESPASDCAQYVGLTNRIASCMRQTISNAADLYFDPDTGLYSYVSRAITALMTLGVVVYGIMASAGMIERVGRDSIMLIFKIALIGFFTTHADLVYDRVTTMMDTTAAAVIGFNPTDGEAVGQAGDESGRTSFSQIKCMQNMVTAQAEATGGNPIVGPWMGMDCMIDSVIGIKVSTTVTNPSAGAGNKWYNDNLADADKGPARGMLYLFFSSMQTSIIGLLFAILGFIFIYGMIHLIIKALFVYLSGYLGIAFLVIISPIFIPLAMFKQTKDYFDKWVKLMINFTLQPIIILIFVSFTIAAVDLATYSGSYSIMFRLAGTASQNGGFSLNKYLEDNQAIITKPATILQAKSDPGVTVPPSLTKAAGGLLRGATTNQNCPKGSTDPQCTNVRSFQLWHKAIDWDKLAAARSPAVTPANGATTPGQQLAREVLSAVLFCGIVIFVMNGLLQIVPTIITDLLGDFGQSPNMMSTFGKLPGSQKGGAGGMGGMVNSLTSAMSSMAGKRT